MLAKLLKFVLFTRISKGGLIAIILSIIFFTLSRLTFGQSSQGPPLVGILVTTVILLLLLSLGGAMILKSDLDYLYTLPIDRWKIGLALYFSSIILSLLFIYFVVFSSLVSSIPLGSILPGVVDLLTLGVGIVSLSIVMQEMSTKAKVGIISLLGLWLISPAIGFQYSPTSIYLGKVYEGLLSSLALSVIAVYYAVKNLGRFDEIIAHKVSRTSRDVSSIVSFDSSSPFMVMLKFRLSYLTLSTRYGGLGYYSVRYRVARVLSVILVVTIIAIIYFFAMYFAIIRSPKSEITFVASFLSTIYILVLSFAFIGLGNVISERLWLGYMALGEKFLMYFLASIGLQSLVIMSPLIISNAVLGIVIDKTFLFSSLFLLSSIPSYAVLSTYIILKTNPMQARGDYEMTNVQLTPKMFLSGMGIGFASVIYANEFTLYFFVSSAIAIYSIIINFIIILCILLLLRGNRGIKLISELTERNYI